MNWLAVWSGISPLFFPLTLAYGVFLSLSRNFRGGGRGRVGIAVGIFLGVAVGVVGVSYISFSFLFEGAT